MKQLQATSRSGQRALLCTLVLFACTPVFAQSSRVVMVEEHWELTLSQPEPERSAPQATMLMSPVGDISGLHFLVTLNHVTAPAYGAGGVQVQAWDGEQLLDERSAEQGAKLSHSDEAVHWVQRFTLDNGTLHFAVVNGTSESWEEFGGEDLSVSVSTTLTGLNAYRPGVSLTESQVGYAENRVSSLVLTKLVWQTEDGQVYEQSAPIPIDTSLDP